MKILKITTHWTAEEADCIYQLLDDMKVAIWECYGEEIIEMHKALRDEQLNDEDSDPFNDELLF